MIKARLLTIGTEIVSGEVVNSNAAWVSTQLENLGVRVFSHLSVRDQRDEILRALGSVSDEKIVVVTGGLGPTSDDITRECLAQFAGRGLDFDETVFTELAEMHRSRGLPIREAHKHQCYFPRGSERLLNPVGTAHGFTLEQRGCSIFILPGPPRELEGMWNAEVLPRLRRDLPANPYRWRRWTCLGTAESEVAELVENALAGMDLEVGYRAAIPYVKVKVYVDPSKPEHLARINAIALALKPFIVAVEEEDLAVELLKCWKKPALKVQDLLCENYLLNRLLGARKAAGETCPRLEFAIAPAAPGADFDLRVSGHGQRVRVEGAGLDESVELPYKTVVETDRGRRSAAEWALWLAVKKLRASSAQA